MVRLPNEDFTAYPGDGINNVAAYLATLDISGFDPKAPPPNRQAFWDIVPHNRPPEEAELADSIDLLKYKAAITIADVVTTATGSLAEGLNDRKTDAPSFSAWRRAAMVQSATTQPMPIGCQRATPGDLGQADT
jgi:hypothetical protein